MPNNVTIPATGTGDALPAVATELIGGAHYQLFKLIDGNVGSTTPLATSANPLFVRFPSAPQVSQANSPWIVDARGFTQPVTGSLVVSQSGIAPIVGSIGVTQLGGPWSVVGSVFMSPSSVTVQSSITVFQGGAPWTNINSSVVYGNVAHGTADAGDPVKIGAFAVQSEFPSPVGSGTRVNALADHHGRLIVTGIPQSMKVNRSNDYVGPLSGTVVWSANVNGQINITTLKVMAGSATAGVVTVFYAQSGPPVNYTVGSGVTAFRGEMAPSATVKPGAVVPFGLFPCKAGQLNDALRISITTTMQIYLQVDGYEEF